MKVLGWYDYHGEMNGKNYRGIYLCVCHPLPEKCSGVGQSCRREKISMGSQAEEVVRTLQPGDEIQQISYDRFQKVNYILI